MDDLKKLMAQLEGEKTTSLIQPPSPFFNFIRDTPLSPRYRSTTDLYYHDDSDLVSYLRNFNTNMNVYQVRDLARCRMLAATLRDNAKSWF